MIKLRRTDPPVELTPELQAELTAEFKHSGKSVWHLDFLKAALLKISHGKCAYCECPITEEANYLEVEHFEDKDGFPDKVLEWKNLLPACKRCNGNKSNHDVTIEPIVNPCDEDPRSHLNFDLYRFEGKTPIGINTEEVLDLNETERMTGTRFKIGEQTKDNLIKLQERVEEFLNDTTSVRKRNKILGSLRALILEATPPAEYSATVATIVTHSGKYAFVVEQLKALALWNQELDSLNQRMLAIAYPRV